jgi:uncharacterized membrane protein YphA (DoxX/SURF4 family)
MSFRDSLAISLTPLLLRLALGVTFVWAGAGKVLESMPVQGEQAAALANMGVLTPVRAAPTGFAAPATLPPPLLQTGQPAAPKYSASDFPEPVEVKRLYGIALLIDGAAHPGADAEGKPRMALWPANAARGMWPSICAWAVAVTELVGGFFCLVGLFTRLSALGIAGTMLGAMWLTVIGPAMQSGATRFGFLPDHPAFDVSKWKDVLWQFSLFMSALGVFFAGPGALAVDRMLFPRSLPVSKPKPAAPAPAKPAA